MSSICAISTPYGSGGIAVVRVSGEDAISRVDELYRGRKSLQSAAAYTIHYGEIVCGEEVLDEVLVSVFRAPRSFTGEDVVEISCHGSIYVQQTLLQWLIDGGCQLAKPGEFTQRAFLNGKMDLTEAEAVADLIAAQTKAEKDLALAQLKGGISKELAHLRERLLTFTSLIELELDFADHEELEFADRTELHQLVKEIATNLAELIASFKTGNAIKQGVPVAIIGAPNVGKSTLLNALLGEERAIVSDIQGTTRDTVEETLVIGGMLFRIIDTAGMRQTTDTIENLGIARSKRAADKASVIIYLHDATKPDEEPLYVPEEGKMVIDVYNKADLAPSFNGGMAISARDGEIKELVDALVGYAEQQCEVSHAVTVTNARHYEALQRAYQAIEAVSEGLQMGISGEFLSMDLQDCLAALGEITGHITSQEVLNNIFSKFCIGK